MHDQSSSLESEAHAYLDQAVLQIMLDNERQRPISETELARIVSTPGHVPASLKRLRVGGLIHRWNDLATDEHIRGRPPSRLPPVDSAGRWHFLRQPQVSSIG